VPGGGALGVVLLGGTADGREPVLHRACQNGERVVATTNVDWVRHDFQPLSQSQRPAGRAGEGSDVIWWDGGSTVASSGVGHRLVEVVSESNPQGLISYLLVVIGGLRCCFRGEVARGSTRAHA